MKILVTGFDPFGGEKINPSYEAVKLLPDTILGVEIIKLEVPTVAVKSYKKCIEAIELHNVDVVVNVGQAGGRFAITPEKVAINLNDFRISDNEGNQLVDQKIFEDGENAYFSSLPVKAMVERMKESNVMGAVSYSAGTFVCNHIMYAVAHYIKKNNLNIRSGFIHIPYMNEQAVHKPNVAAMSIETLATGLEKCIEAIILNQDDLNVVGGETH